ncbi:class I SAM-dependent methyltransferase [Luteimonas suaedae]|uniref:class I SAM-dependent methyltransferase n=1 Tax=Luteimonas suaedae TaxID=2605430 RepID=UPI0011ED8F6A|nr:class I SAM-dependent methyltransferase [Luteimonas suaedae]
MSLHHLHAVRDFELHQILGDLRRGQVGDAKLRLLDIGAGTGRQAARLASLGFEVTAVDLPGSAYVNDRLYPIIDYDGRNLPLDDASVDVVFSSNVLEHVQDLSQLLAETFRVLTPDGLAVHVLPTPAWRWWTHLSHYPWLAMRVVQRLRSDAARYVTAHPDHPSAGSAPSILWPSRHGERGSALTEAWYFSARWWRKVFTDAGFAVQVVRPVGLFYTGSMICAERLSIPARACFARWLGSSCRVFVLRPTSTTASKTCSTARRIAE